jgi:two-component system response regulator YesN
MYSVLLVSSMYTQTLNIKRMIPWEEYGCRLYIEYSDSSAIDTLHEIAPDILIFTSRPLFIDQSSIGRAFRSLKKKMEIIVISGDVGGGLGIDGINHRTLKAEWLSPDLLGETIRNCCISLSAPSLPSVDSSRSPEELLGELLDAQPDPGGPFYLLRVRFAEKITIRKADEKKVERKFRKILGDLYGAWLNGGEYGVCVLIYERENAYALFSLRILEKAIEEILAYLEGYGKALPPVLLVNCRNNCYKVQTGRDRGILSYLGNQMDEMEKTAYFCIEKRVLTWDQTEERKRICDISELQKPLNALFSATLTGDADGVTRHLRTCYLDVLKKHPLYSNLSLARAQLRAYVNILNAMRDTEDEESRFDAEGFRSLEEELHHVTEVFQEFCSKTGRRKRFSPTVVVALIEMENRYTENLTLESVAMHVGVSAPYFSRLFSEALGVGFARHYNSLRMFKAKQFMRAGACSVQEVSDKVGFTDVKYFSRVFKDICGKTPNQYLREKRMARN